jgi:hypothetical protein
MAAPSESIARTAGARKVIRVILWIGDQIERGVPDALGPLSRFESACYAASQFLYRLAWRLIELREPQPK